MVSEVNVSIKDDEKRLTKKFLIYDIFTTDHEDQVIKECIEETLENFDGTPDSVKVTIILEMQ